MKSKKQFFKDKIERVTYEIWDCEFKVSKTRQIREEVRRTRDNTVEGIKLTTARLENETDEELKKKTQEELSVLVDDKARFERQMEMLDNQVNGFIGDETHEPVIGVIEQIGSLTELREMYKSYI